MTNKLTPVFFLVYFLFAGQLIASSEKRGGDIVQSGDQYIELVRTNTSGKYKFTSKLVPQREKRLIYNYVLDRLINGEAKESSVVVSNLLPTEQDRVDFLNDLYKVVDSVVWADGNAYMAYEILLDYEDFGEQGFFLANKAVARNAKKCNLDKLDLLFVTEFVCDARPEAATTLLLIADCSLKPDGDYTVALASAVGLAKLGRLAEANAIVQKVERLKANNEIAISTCKATRELMKRLPTKWSDLYSRMGDVFF